MRYDADSRSYAITTAGRSQTFAPADRSADRSTAAIDVYERRSGDTVDTLTLTRPGTSGRLAYTYVGGGFWQRTIQSGTGISGTFDAFSYGVATPGSAVPRTGSASYDIDLLGVASGTAQPFAISGGGELTVDFASGQIVATVAGIAQGTADSTVVYGLAMSGSAQLTSGSNRFSGTITMTPDQGNLSGAWNGRFYGPAAQEIGATFALTGTGPLSSAAGVFIGRGADNLLAQSGVRHFQAQASRGSVGTYSVAPVPTTLTIDADAGTVRAFALVYNAADLVASETNGRMTVYRRVEGDNTFTLRLYRPGSGNDQLALSYVSFGIEDRNVSSGGTGGASSRFWHAFDYGLRTNPGSIPRTGSAEYSGILAGYAASATANYSLSGTADLTFWFDSGTFGAAFSPMATNLQTGASHYLDAYRGNGVIDFSGGRFWSEYIASQYHNLLLDGRFYGPSAQEIGASFRGSGRHPVDGTLTVAGAIVGRRR